MMRRSLLTLALLLGGSSLNAGGPLVLEGPAGNTPVRYNKTINLNFDQGLLLNGLSNAQIDALLVQAVSLWNNVSTATVQIVQSSDLASNIDVNNYASLLPNGTGNDPSFSDNINPVIYDDDGQVIDDFFGSGQSDNIAGFAASVFTVGGTEFIEGYAVLNGKASLGLDGDDLVILVTHEIGHLIGLDHSQLDIDNNETMFNVCTSSASRDDYPMMYPFLCRTSHNLHIDDEIAISGLYPVSNLDQLYGQVTGFFRDPADNPILGANLWVENISTGDKASIVSDYRMEANGFFGLYLPPGQYTLNANAINTLFTDASSVGPYASSLADISFSSPNPVADVSYQGSSGSTVTLDVVAGEANEVIFRSDGSGSNTGGNSIIDLGGTAAGINPAAGGSSGGQLTAASLLLLLLGLSGRLFSRWTRPSQPPR